MRDYQTKANQGGLPDSITAEKLGAGEANSTLTESKTAVQSSGQTLAPADGTGESTDQLAKALAIYGGGGAEYMLDTGAVNTYVLNPVSPKKAAPAYFDGMTVSFKPGSDNTGAATVNVASLGVKSITDIDGVALTGGEIAKSVTIRFNSSGDRFEIVSAVTEAQVLQGYIDGGILSNGTDTDHDIDLTGVVASLTDGSGFKIFSDGAPPTKQIDANWAEGNNQGGFPSGLTLSANTEYNFFLIGKTDGTLDAGFDTSATAANLLSDATGYTWYRRILSVFTDGSSNIYAFLQQNDYVQYNEPILDLTDAITGTNFSDATLSAPGHTLVKVMMRATNNGVEEKAGGTLRTKGNTGILNNVFNSFLSMNTQNNISGIDIYGQGTLLVDNNSQIQYAARVTDTTMQLRTAGWWDNRGRNQ